MCRGQRPCNGDDRRVGGTRLGKAGHQVGDARAILSGKEDTGAPRGARKSVGHVDTGALITHTDESDVPVTVERIEDLHAGRADEPENVARAVSREAVDYGLTASSFIQLSVSS
jgi:hypothetical protein